MNKKPGSYIPSPYPIHAALEASIEGALQSGEISHEEANAMLAVARPLCTNHNQPAVVLWGGEACCEACVRAFVRRP
jgi:hypothetical protein